MGGGGGVMKPNHKEATAAVAAVDAASEGVDWTVGTDGNTKAAAVLQIFVPLKHLFLPSSSNRAPRRERDRDSLFGSSRWSLTLVRPSVTLNVPLQLFGTKLVPEVSS